MSERGNELKPCPFCGGKAKLMADQTPWSRVHGYFVTCLKCGVETPRNKRSAGEAAFAWNMRKREAGA